MNSEAQLPESVQEIADVIGRDKALILAGMANGCMYVPQPRRMTTEHWIAQTIGHEAAVELSTEFPGFILKLATCRFVYTHWRNQRIWELHQNGVSNGDIAELFSITERHIRNIINRFYPSSQMMLF